MKNKQACQPHDTPLPVGDRCTGKCCEQFYVFNHEDWRRTLVGEETYISKMYRDDPDEVGMIMSMIIPVPGTKNGYTCRLFDGTSCTAYERRPRMCSGYPYGRRCLHGKLCTWEDGRRGKNNFSHLSRYHLPVL